MWAARRSARAGVTIGTPRTQGEGGWPDGAGRRPGAAPVGEGASAGGRVAAAAAQSVVELGGLGGGPGVVVGGVAPSAGGVPRGLPGDAARRPGPFAYPAHGRRSRLRGRPRRGRGADRLADPYEADPVLGGQPVDDVAGDAELVDAPRFGGGGVDACGAPLPTTRVAWQGRITPTNVRRSDRGVTGVPPTRPGPPRPS